MGIKVPILKSIAKDLLKNYDIEEILNNLNNNYFECVLLEGLVIAYYKCSLEEKIPKIKDYLTKIDNWAICDIFVSSLKIKQDEQDIFLNFINNLFTSNHEYTVRFAFVILLNYYINDKYIDMVLDKCLSVKSDYYYVKMSISWTLSIALVKYFDKTLNFMQEHQSEFDKWTYNKALQKARESFRIDDDKKIILQSTKIK